MAAAAAVVAAVAAALTQVLVSAAAQRECHIDQTRRCSMASDSDRSLYEVC
jgi:hypothetical protein